MAEGVVESWEPFSLTFVLYPKGDKLGYVAAGLSLAPVFLIVALVTATLARRDIFIATALAGQLCNTALNVAIKHAVKEPRPPCPGLEFLQSNKPVGFSPYGMPSNHSQFVWFFGAFWCCFLLSHRNNVCLDEQFFPQKHRGMLSAVSRTARVLRLVACVLCILGAVAVSWSRVYLGYHTFRQVFVGAIVGAMGGIAWYGSTISFFERQIFTPVVNSWLGTYFAVSNLLGRRDVVTWEFALSRISGESSWQSLRHWPMKKPASVSELQPEHRKVR